jgi:GWxTD domain-containing protein
MLVTQPRRTPAVLLVALILATACVPRTNSGTPQRPAPNDDSEVRRGSGGLDPVAAYANAGLIAEGDPIQFIGGVNYFAGATADSTLMLVTLSMPNRDFTFAPEQDGYRGRYQVSLDLRRGAEVALHVDARESVRVASYRESTREDESLIFQQFVAAAPGQYVLAISVRDEGSARNGRHEMLVNVPRITSIGLSSPVAVYEATPRTSSDSLPELVANPRATAIFGRDTVVQVYLEGYGLPPETPVALAALSDQRVIVWRDTIELDSQSTVMRASVIRLPVSVLGVGRVTLSATPLNAADTVTAALFVTFGEEWAISSFEEMLSLLRFYASDTRLAQLRETAGEGRADAWGAFYRETDPDPRTPEHEALRTYFARVRVANQRFGDEGTSGWLSDRGEVYVTLGEPDQILEQGDNSFNQRGRAQMWRYNQQRLQLVFIDQSGFGRWRLTTGSEADFDAAAQRLRK